MASVTTLWGVQAIPGEILTGADNGPSERDEQPEAPVVSPGALPEEVHTLARQLSRAASHFHDTDTAYLNPFHENTTDARLDPNSDEFNADAWVRSVLALVSRDPERFPRRTAGVSFSNLKVHGFGSPTDYQKTVGNVWLSVFGTVKRWMGHGALRKIQILYDFEGVVQSGEMLIVLGRPGSGCSTFLQTISGRTAGFVVDPTSNLQYQGVSSHDMHKHFRGEVIYNAETDTHFPRLTVGETLAFAARARAPRNRLPGVTRDQYAMHMRDVIMAIFGLSHTVNTRVGNDFIRGVSGGERKRVSIAECILSGSPVQCWDNSTRGLDSANALEFIKTLKLGTHYAGTTALVAIYQCSQSAYDLFDKVIVLYEGREIYFGPCAAAKEFFTSRGWVCPPRQTTADFLTSLTNPAERVPRQGWEHRVPCTAAEFVRQWQESPERARLLRDIAAYEEMFPLGGDNYQKFRDSRKAAQAKRMSVKSPYTISVPMQIRLCLTRSFQRLRADMSNFYATTIGNFSMALIIGMWIFGGGHEVHDLTRGAGSVFYNLSEDTSSFYSRGALLFFAILMNAFSSALEILTLYAQRPIVEKHESLALYHPFAESIASMIMDLPSKLLVAVTFNITLYFMSNLRREPGPFFVFWIFSFVSTLCMSSIFRTIGAASRTLAQALAPAAIFILALVIYTGFTIPTSYMKPWFRWVNYLNPIGYAFESLMVNEFHNREFPCTAFVPAGPSYANATGLQRTCTVTGATPGSSSVNGDNYIGVSFNYVEAHKWRNLGIILAFWIVFTLVYLVASEQITSAKSKGEVLLFRRGRVPSHLKVSAVANDAEKGGSDVTRTPDASEGTAPNETEVIAAIQRQMAIFHWRDLCYDIKIKGKDRRLLEHVDGWVKPGTLTALMGASGAGKTTLLDVLASRVTMGVVSGEVFVDGRLRDQSFQRKTGYVQQQDLHLQTATVRESLIFSAQCRQPKSVPNVDKLEYVEAVIKLLEMEDYAEAIVGVPGEGLNVEQRKRLTIGVELAAKPDLLLFFDEPSSGLDSQTAWAMCKLMRKLANNGQAILCTIHQPSAILMQEFDRLLFLASGGRTVYFGDIGENCQNFIDYFVSNGAHPCPPEANPAEWMLEVIGAAPGHHSKIDWHETWRNSKEFADVHRELEYMETELPKATDAVLVKTGLAEFAMPIGAQLWYCLKRVWQQYWRTPSYIYSKIALCTLAALFVGFSFYRADNTIQGLQNQMFSIFMLLTIFGNLTQQIMPMFVGQRALYEARERPSKAYSWKAFLGAQLLVELPWQTLCAVLTFISWYYPIGLYRNAVPTGAVHERGALMFLLILAFYLFTSTFSHMIIAGVEIAEVGGMYGNLLFSLSLIFCGVLASPSALPRFWIFMYRVSPFTYLVSAMLSTGVASSEMICSSVELVQFNPPSGQTCATYMADYLVLAGGVLTNPNATSACEFCSVTNTNAFLGQIGVSFSTAWRNFGLMWAYIIFNIFGCITLYWLARVPKKRSESQKE
ncbi:hypothetical protein CALVIDRAFT_602620 [Calocera viscosa TUFC12733]|uniref:ABC transporter domain-containing protein n=1 Tax=Calocera viscosa (strain TUFC12733) TaxID=1330018 RepID=A0A167GU89_CALVF|nr:hypothetical protein CALVIDRAFT_602620 [Calocera viscosa TUFC12733]